MARPQRRKTATQHIQARDDVVDELMRSMNPPEWTEMGALANGWRDAGTGYPPAFSRDRLGVIRLRGVISGGNLDSQFFTMPDTFWPAYNMSIPAVAFGPTVAFIRVGSNGSLWAFTTTSSWLALDGVAYTIEQQEVS